VQARLLARQLFDLEQAIERTATEPIGARLADLLPRLADRKPTPSHVRGLAQSDLARMIGASRESVSRQLASWERAGLVRSGQRSVDLLDEEALRDRARAG
jgi:CRP-like cAMP-binding protein